LICDAATLRIAIGLCVVGASCVCVEPLFHSFGAFTLDRPCHFVKSGKVRCLLSVKLFLSVEISLLSTMRVARTGIWFDISRLFADTASERIDKA